MWTHHQLQMSHIDLDDLVVMDYAYGRRTYRDYGDHTDPEKVNDRDDSHHDSADNIDL